MNNPLSAGIGKYCQYHGLDETLTLIKDAGFDCVDFWLCSYCEKEDSPMKQPDWRSWVLCTRETFEKHGLKIGQCHAHWRLHDNIEEDFSFRMPTKTIHRNIEAAKMLGTDLLVFHPMERWYSLRDSETVDKVIDINAKWFGDLVSDAENFGVNLCVENLFDHKHKCSPCLPCFPFSRPEHLNRLAGIIGSDRLGFCLDTGHANIAGVSPADAVKAMGTRLKALHMDDNYGLIGPVYEDLHLFPGYGRIDWKAFFSELKAVNFTGPLNMEVSGELWRYPYDAALPMLRAAREMLQYMRDNY